ncbi:unnamed protein product, partial [Urochloa humidicola]
GPAHFPVFHSPGEHNLPTPRAEQQQRRAAAPETSAHALRRTVALGRRNRLRQGASRSGTFGGLPSLLPPKILQRDGAGPL